MTRQELSAILEQFATCVISTAMADMEPEDQYNLIAHGIDNITDTVMLFVERPVSIPQPSVN